MPCTWAVGILWPVEPFVGFVALGLNARTGRRDFIGFVAVAFDTDRPVFAGD